jgi:hypothetical protein
LSRQNSFRLTHIVHHVVLALGLKLHLFQRKNARVNDVKQLARNGAVGELQWPGVLSKRTAKKRASGAHLFNFAELGAKQPIEPD